MLEEMGHIIKLSQTGGWHTAKDTFAEIMHKIEEGEVKWADKTDIMHIRWEVTVSATQREVRASNTDMNVSQQFQQNKSKNKFSGQFRGKTERQSRAPTRELPCRHYNWGK